MENTAASSPRGKWLVAFILAGSLLFLAFALWYFLTQSPPDQRFNMARDSVPAQLTVADLLPSDLADFKREGSITNSAADGNDASSATYVNTNDSTQRAILAVKPIQQLSSAALADSLKSAACGDGNASSTLHVDAHPPFAFATCPPSNGKTGSNFVWVNGQWLFSASSSDPEVLVQFVNVYPY